MRGFGSLMVLGLETSSLRGERSDPSELMGMKVLPGGRLRVRTFAPWADRVELLRHETGEAIAILRRVIPKGLFEVELEGQPFKHRFRMSHSGGIWEAEDPYRFASLLNHAEGNPEGVGLHSRAYERLGAHPTSLDEVPGVAFVVWAPHARRVSVVGPFNHWDGRCHPMRRHGRSGLWELFIPHLVKGELYKFEIEDASGLPLPLKADPFAFRCEMPPGSASVVEGLGTYAWGDASWMAKRRTKHKNDAPISIYEVHAGSWMRKGDGDFLGYRELAERLVPYALELGFTHLQLLPISEHPYYPSWGYQPLGLFAPTSRYGSPDDFRFFVDACHQAGLGVILDWVPAHFPADEHGLGLFDGTHLFEHADPRKGRHMDWGTLIYDFGKPEVQNFLLANALFWLEQFHIDGLRVDAVASMLYLDYSRKDGEWLPNQFGGRENLEAVSFLKRMNEAIYDRFPDVMTIAEESTAWPMVSRPTHQGGLGFGFKWNLGWMHDALHYLGRAMPHRRYHHQEITFSMAYHHTENFVLPLSHDEAVHGKGSLLGRMPGTRWEQFANLRLLYAYQMAHPGKKLLFMGNELAPDREWDHNQSIDWSLLQQPTRQGMQRLVKDLNQLYREHPALHQGDGETWGFQWLDDEDHKNSVISFLRRGKEPGSLMVIALNLTALPRSHYRLGVPYPGRYRERINTDSVFYGGQNIGNLGGLETRNTPKHGFHQSLSVTLPPLGALFFTPDFSPGATPPR